LLEGLGLYSSPMGLDDQTMGGGLSNLFIEESACRLYNCMETIRQELGSISCVSLETDCLNSLGQPRFNCLQQLIIDGQNPFCTNPNEDEEFNRNMFRMRYECPNWRFEYPGWYEEVVESDGRLIPTGRGWYGTAEDGPPDDIDEGGNGIDRGDRTNKNLTPSEWREIFGNVPCGSCADTDDYADGCSRYVNPDLERVEAYFTCVARKLVDMQNERRGGGTVEPYTTNPPSPSDSPLTASEKNRLKERIGECCRAFGILNCNLIYQCIDEIPETLRFGEALREIRQCATWKVFERQQGGGTR
jgi:hypothetical protein